MNTERAILALVAAVMLAIPWVQAVAKVFRSAFQTDDTSNALRLTVATAAVMVVLGLRRAWFTRPLTLAAASLATSVIAVLVLAWRGGGFSADMFALPVVCPLAAWAATYMAKLLPRSMDGVARQRPRLSILWCIVAGLAMFQNARLATYISDPSFGWWITVEDPFWSEHMCLTAYLYGAELNRSGIENVYDPGHYPGLTPDAEAKTSIDNFTPDDPFQYPPPFLALPRLALSLSNDFLTIRTFWFALQTTAFAILAILLAGWVDGASGRFAAFLLPLCWLSIPVLTTFQWGQFHLVAVMLGVSAMLAFEKRHYATGGALLAAAILSKIFPAVLLIPLIIRRRPQPVAWTAAFVVAFSLAALPVIGSKPYTAFFSDHLPLLRSGEAFSFAEAWPDYRAWLISSNQSPMNWPLKLAEAGGPNLTAIASRPMHTVYGLFVVVVAVLASRRRRSNQHQALTWLALLGLASLFSPGAFADYTSATSIWLLTLLPLGCERKRWRWFLLACWVFMFFLPGIYPLPPILPSPVMVLSFVGVGLMITLCVWVLLRPVAQGASVDAPLA